MTKVAFLNEFATNALKRTRTSNKIVMSGTCSPERPEKSDDWSTVGLVLLSIIVRLVILSINGHCIDVVATDVTKGASRCLIG
jgi:hypothetical protein